MRIDTLKTRVHLRRDNRSVNASLRAYDFPILIGKMKHSYNWAKGNLNAMILMNKPGKQVMLTVLHEGTEIESFQSNDSITFQIIEGRLKYQSQKQSVTLDKGQLLTLNENIKYNLTTKEETAYLLTIASDTILPIENYM